MAALLSGFQLRSSPSWGCELSKTTQCHHNPVAQAYCCHLRGKWIYGAVGAGGDHSKDPGPASSLGRNKCDSSSLPDTLDSNPGLSEERGNPLLSESGSQRASALLCLHSSGGGKSCKEPKEQAEAHKALSEGFGLEVTRSSMGFYLSLAVTKQPHMTPAQTLHRLQHSGSQRFPTGCHHDLDKPYYHLNDKDTK